MMSTFSMRPMLVGGLALLAGLVPCIGRAQLAIPTVHTFDATDSLLPVTAGEAAADVDNAAVRASNQVSYTRANFPTDSVHAVAAGRAQLWLARLRRESVSGLQLEPYAAVRVAAGMDSLARQTIAKRLATPGLSAADRAYTLDAAVAAFADPDAPSRLPVAEHYMSELKAMGVTVVEQRYLAELTLVAAYDALGRSADVARHGVAAMHLVPWVPLSELSGSLMDPQISIYPTIVRALVVQPNGRATVAGLNHILLAATTAIADSIAMDSSFYWLTRYAHGSVERMLQGLAQVGQAAGPVVSNRWLNRPDSGYGVMPVNDGRVRVVETLNYGCGICVFAAVQLQRMVEADTAMRAVVVTNTTESWGNRRVSPDESAAHLADFWVRDKQLHYPIALWIEHRSDTASDGEILENFQDDSAEIRYPEVGKPQFYILDGLGRIRASFFTFDRVIERQIMAIVHSLELEGKAEHAPAAKAGT